MSGAVKTIALGQCWIYSYRLELRQSRFVVCAIQDLPRIGRIIHLGVFYLVSEETGEDVLLPRIDHLPFTEAAVQQSALEMEAYVFLDSVRFADAYATWRASFDAGSAGVFSAPVEKVVRALKNSADRSFAASVACGA